MPRLLRTFRFIERLVGWALRSALGHEPGANARRALGIGSILFAALNDRRMKREPVRIKVEP